MKFHMRLQAACLLTVGLHLLPCSKEVPLAQKSCSSRALEGLLQLQEFSWVGPTVGHDVDLQTAIPKLGQRLMHGVGDPPGFVAEDAATQARQEDALGAVPPPVPQRREQRRVERGLVGGREHQAGEGLPELRVVAAVGHGAGRAEDLGHRLLLVLHGAGAPLHACDLHVLVHADSQLPAESQHLRVAQAVQPGVQSSQALV
mmetsp:Transcript_124326/g.387068  ORF Transcript_124326/g.387068 Transcript_124326/m.387068 type:complete len:202 (+) Transcript_124326:61-666(+)